MVLKLNYRTAQTLPLAMPCDIYRAVKLFCKGHHPRNRPGRRSQPDKARAAYHSPSRNGVPSRLGSRNRRNLPAYHVEYLYHAASNGNKNFISPNAHTAQSLAAIAALSSGSTEVTLPTESGFPLTIRTCIVPSAGILAT